MLLYDCETAPSPRRARIAFAEKGVDVEKRQVDLGKGEQFTPAFKAINPACTVPVLELDDGSYITENEGIARYLEEVYAEPPLMGVTPLEKARVAEWNFKVGFDGLLAIAEAFRNSAKGLKNRALTGPRDYEQIPELVQRGFARTEAFSEVLNNRLRDNEFIAGDHFSVADITAVVALDFAVKMKLPILDKFEHLARWHAQIAQRPSYKA